MEEPEYTAICAAVLAGFAIKDAATANSPGETTIIQQYIDMANALIDKAEVL